MNSLHYTMTSQNWPLPLVVANLTSADTLDIHVLTDENMALNSTRGGDSNIKMPGCVCLVFESRPILNETLSCKTYPY